MVRYQMSGRDFLRIGLTGGIGAGKSTVAGRLRALGAHVLDADAAARRVVEPGEEGLLRLVARYGQEILLPGGGLNRKAVANIIFGSEAERQAVNAMLHPLIRDWMQKEEAALLEQAPGLPVVWEAPLLIESGMDRDMDEVWVVVAADETRIARMMRRDGASYAQAQARLNSQLPQREQMAHADVIIENTGDLAELRKRVDAYYRALLAHRKDSCNKG